MPFKDFGIFNVLPQRGVVEPVFLTVTWGADWDVCADPRIGWTDSMAVATDGYLYFTENQLWRTPSHFPGTERRVRPFALFRAKLPGNGTKVQLL